MSKKAILLIDGSGVFHEAKTLGKLVDYKKFLDYFSEEAGCPDHQQIPAVYYTPLDNDNVKQRQFTGWLRTNGYRVVTTPVIHGPKRTTVTKTDTPMAVDLYRYLSQGYEVYLVSGNSVFVYPMLYFKAGDETESTGVVHLYSYKRGTAKTLSRLANTHKYLEDADIYFHNGEIAPSSPDNWCTLEEEDVTRIN